MSNIIDLRSISFDTSFLLKDSSLVDGIIKVLKKDGINCYITSTVVSEIEQLKIWGRITKNEYQKVMKRWNSLKPDVIDFKNRFLSDGFGKTCVKSMEEHHGVKPKDIINDCSILVTTLKNGIDIFLSEDYHFTSKITEEVISEIKNLACTEFHMMCGPTLYNLDSKTFLEAYNNKKIDIDIIENNVKLIKKSKKNFWEN